MDALNAAGYAIVKRGKVPSWMKNAEGVYQEVDRPDNELIDGMYLLVSGLYYVSGDGETQTEEG